MARYVGHRLLAAVPMAVRLTAAVFTLVQGILGDPISWVTDDKAVFDANPNSWGGRIDVDRVIFRPMPETAARVASVLKGETDLITQLPPDQWDRVNQNATTTGKGVVE